MQIEKSVVSVRGSMQGYRIETSENPRRKNREGPNDEREWSMGMDHNPIRSFLP